MQGLDWILFYWRSKKSEINFNFYFKTHNKNKSEFVGFDAKV